MHTLPVEPVILDKGNAARIARVWRRLGAWIDLHPWQALALILLLALTLGAAKLLKDPPGSQPNQTSHWLPIVLNVAHGNGYVACFPKYFPFCGPTNEVTAAREPAPVLLFAAVAKLTNDSLFAAGVFQLAVSLAILPAIFFLTRELANTRAALLAALLWSVYLPAIENAPQVSGDLLATLGVSCGFFFFIRARRIGRTRDWVLAGMCIGLGTLSRSVVLIIAPPLAIGLILSPHFDEQATYQSRTRNLRPFALFTVAFGLMLLPWLARNYAAFGRLVLGTTLVGYDLYRESYMLPTDNSLRYVGPDEAEHAIYALVARRHDLKGTENEAQMDVVYRDEAIQVIRSEPLRYGALSAYRFLMLWFDWGIRTCPGADCSILDKLQIVQQALLLVAATLGLRGMWRRAWPLVVSVVTISLAYMAVISLMRYIVPVMPLTVALSAVGLMRVGEKLGTSLKNAPFTLASQYFQRASREWGLSPRIAAWIFCVPLVGAMTLSLVQLDKSLYRFLLRENGPVEWGQFVLFTLAGIAGAGIAIKRFRARHRWQALVCTGFAFAMFFVVGKDIAWGRHVVALQILQHLLAVNKQYAMTVHNSRVFQSAFSSLLFLAGAFGSLAYFINKRIRVECWWDQANYLLVPPLFLIPAFSLVFGYKLLRFFVWHDPGLMITEYGEWAELCLAFGLCIFTWLNYRRLRRENGVGTSARSVVSG